MSIYYLTLCHALVHGSLPMAALTCVPPLLSMLLPPLAVLRHSDLRTWKLGAPTMDPTSSWLLPRSTAIGWLNKEVALSSRHLWWGPPAPTLWDHCFSSLTGASYWTYANEMPLRMGAPMGRYLRHRPRPNLVESDRVSTDGRPYGRLSVWADTRRQVPLSGCCSGEARYRPTWTDSSPRRVLISVLI